MAIVIDHTLQIDAPFGTVWHVLTDLENYGEWNPFVVACESSLQPGATIYMQVKVLAKAQPQKETIFEHVPQRLLSYGINLPLGLLKSQRVHELEILDARRTLYKSKFKLTGLLSPLVAMTLGENLRRGFAEMSAALKTRAEILSEKF